jgi:LmbE family N-acetylglucosaminyl deacetylase
MLLDALAAATDYAHVYVAPHLDDAVLSCGGQIAQYTADGARVLAVTLCAASPLAAAPLTPYAEHLHRTYGLGSDPTAGRRQEDDEALALLGCDGLHLDQLDAPYRLAAYGERSAVFSQPVPDDPLGPATLQILQQLRAQQPQARFYLPLGIGSHVDHLVVCAAGLAFHEQGADVRWYEDAPYAVDPGLIARRLEMLDEAFEPVVVPIDGMLDRKLQAIACYRSQVGKLFRDRPMEQVMTEYAATVAGQPDRFGERHWVRGAATDRLDRQQ